MEKQRRVGISLALHPLIEGNPLVGEGSPLIGEGSQYYHQPSRTEEEEESTTAEKSEDILEENGMYVDYTYNFQKIYEAE